MKLIHYSPRPIEKLEDRNYRELAKQAVSIRWGKPIGIWFSCLPGYGWEEWCRQEDFELQNLKYQYQLKISKKCNVLRLKSKQNVLDFTNEFKFCPFSEDEKRFPHYIMEANGKLKKEEISYREFTIREGVFIRWDLVQEKYDAIIISPYRRDFVGNILNFNTQRACWYYGWDCASGCIWEVNAIKEFKLIKVDNSIQEETEKETSWSF